MRFSKSLSQVRSQFILRIVASFFLMLAAFAQTVDAASRFWNSSSGNGNWSVGANWVGGVAPVAGDDLVFQAGVTQLLVTNNFSPNRAWSSILFQGSNYFVRGNAILVTNGITSVNSVGPNHIDADVEVRGSQFWEAQGPLAVLDFNGDINLNVNTLTVRANTGDFFFSGIVSGTGNLVKTNVGTLRMDGAGHNTYSGFTRFDGGVLELDKFQIFPTFTNYISIPGDLTIGDGNGLVGTDVLRLLADDQIADTSDVTVKDSGLFDLNDHADRIGSLTMQGGTVDSGTGTLILGGNLTSLSDAFLNTAFINGHLSLGGASRTFNINPGAAPVDMRINAVISGDAISLFAAIGFTKTGGGSLYLAGTNTYNGTTTIQDGQVVLLADRALGATTTPLGASAGTVVNGNGNLFLSNVQVTNEDLTINSSNPGGAFNASGASVWTGDITLNADTFIASSGSLLLNGIISGVGGFTKLSGGSLTLSGTNANTYIGTTTVRDGALLLDKDVTGGALSGPLVIGEDELPKDADIVRFLANAQLPSDTDVTINSSGLLDLNGFGQNVRNIIFNGGDVDAPSPGSILPIGDITVNRNVNAQAVLSGRMSVLSNPIINVTGHLWSPDLRIDAQLTGAGGFTKNGPGEIGLNAANTYTGLTTVNDGLVEVNNSSALGTTANGTVVNSGGEIALNFGVDVPAEALSLAGQGQSFGALSSFAGSNSWAGNITLTSNATIYVDSGAFLNLSGAVTASGTWDIKKTGTGTLIFSGSTGNSFDDMFVNAGTLVFDKSIANAAGPAELTIGDGSGTDIVRWNRDNQLADSTPIHIALGGRLDLNDMIDTVGAIDGRGVIDLGSGLLRAGADGGSSTFSGQIIGTTGCSLFKFGLGTWALTGNNTYPGQTTVSAGTMVVDGDQHQSPVTVNGTANLAGTGVVGDLQVFGSVRPGNSPGILTSSNVNFAAQGDFFVDLNGSDPGTGYDQLNVRGTNNLGGSTLHLTVGAGFAPAEGDRLTILNNDGTDAIVGTFAGLPNGSLITAGGLEFRIRYDLFNDVTLDVTNTALKLAAAPVVSTGNGNGDIEPGECNLLHITLMNKLAGIVSGVSATLSSPTPGALITQPFSTYPNLPANGMRTNNTPFQISTSPALVCGTNIDLVLIVHTATNGNFSVPFTVFTGTAGLASRFNRIGDQAIPDLGTLDSTITVSGITTPIHHVVVSLHLSHTVDDNLDISLIGPDGTTIDLSSDNGGTSDDYGISCADVDRTVFTDTAILPITSVVAPFRGSFRPEEPLSVYRGKFGPDVNGTWDLRITDDTAGGLGTLHCWSIVVFPTICTPGGGECEQCPGCPVRLNIAHDPSSDSRVLLQWSTAGVGYDLVATNQLQNPPNGFTPIGPPPVVVNSKFTVTNTASGAARFYELRKP